MTFEKRGYILLIVLNRQQQNNLFNKQLILELAAGLGETHFYGLRPPETEDAKEGSLPSSNDEKPILSGLRYGH